MAKISAQLKWARKKKKQGRCTRCGQPRTKYRQLCDPCQQKFSAYMADYRRRLKAHAKTNPPTLETK